jgi:hypothetical protein
MGFLAECERKFDENTDASFSVFQRMNRMFNNLPLAAVIE